MFNQPQKEYDHLGREVIRGKAISSVLPSKVLPFVYKAASDFDLHWDKAIFDSILFMDHKGQCSIIHQPGKWIFTGTLLLSFTVNEKCEHRVSFPKKWLHLERYMNKPYC